MTRGLNFIQVYNRLQGIASGETTEMSGRELRNMIRHIDVDNSRLSHLTQSDLNRMYNVSSLLGSSKILIEHSNNQQLKEQRISIWLERANYAIRVHSNNNRRSTNSKKSANTKISQTTVNKMKKSGPGTPQSKRRKTSNK